MPCWRLFYFFFYHMHMFGWFIFVICLILGSFYFIRLRNKFFRLIESKEYSWDEDSQRYLLMAMLMTSSDLAASTKQWHVQKRAARLVTDEFIEQGDKERFELKIQPQALMDRERQHELPQLQIRWIADICLPLYQVNEVFRCTNNECFIN